MKAAFFSARLLSREKRALRKPSDGDLLNFRFLEEDVLTGNRVVFTELELFRVIARVLLGDVEEAGVRSADQLNQNGGWFGHFSNPVKICRHVRAAQFTRLSAAVKKSFYFVPDKAEN